ncbi:hypothetical protein HYW76_01700 [Candidatus Pacearchaeota archaeon]|nr:hypothetical protein [Candidatus Pacearchaeota archaeon]
MIVDNYLMMKISLIFGAGIILLLILIILALIRNRKREVLKDDLRMI